MKVLVENMTPIVVAFKAHMGWVNAVAVVINQPTPVVTHALRIDLVDSNNRSVREPYHVAGGWDGLERVPRPANPAETVQTGLAAQLGLAKSKLARFNGDLTADQYDWQRGVMLTGRGIIHDDLEDILGSHAHIHVAEGEATRDATRVSIDALHIELVNQDEKDIKGLCETALACSDADEYMKHRRPENARSWTKEHRLIALGAWLHNERA